MPYFLVRCIIDLNRRLEKQSASLHQSGHMFSICVSQLANIIRKHFFSIINEYATFQGGIFAKFPRGLI